MAAQKMLIEVLMTLRNAEAQQRGGLMPYAYDPNTPMTSFQTYTSMTPPLDLRELITRVETVLNGGVPLDAEPSEARRPWKAGGEPEPPRLWITVSDDGGVVFQGNEDHWRDCFFDNVSVEAIKEFCEGNGWTVEIT